VENVLGFFLFLVYIACIIALAAGVTWVVVRISPGRKSDNQPKASSS
jgi:uncharacterized BrkB/YihY/UPF0761 family membrane protein